MMNERTELFPPEVEAFIEKNYLFLSDKKLSAELQKQFKIDRSSVQIKRFRASRDLCRYPAKSRAEQKKLEENHKRITVCGAVTTHRCF